MSRHFSDREIQDDVLRKIQRLTAAGETFVPMTLGKKSRNLVSSFWAQAWCRHLEAYHDHESRLPRGRSYLRNGRVYNLDIQRGVITANVAGSDIYSVRIPVEPMSQESLEGFQRACAGSVLNVLDLLSGRLNENVLRLVADRTAGLFPEPGQIRFVCSCPDYASLCKHAAAVLYGVAVRFEADPALFFQLRGVDLSQLLASQTLESKPASPEIPEEELASIFGIDLGPVQVSEAEPAAPKSKAPQSEEANRVSRENRDSSEKQREHSEPM
ncbi:MAG: hypothetical protein RLZZ142_2232 [Verrucomicrobiota bacterium]|jgi:uncharacterized Zn finger protein